VKRDKTDKKSEGMSSSSDEAEYERAPRPSTWERDGDKQGLHYLLPLKATQGKLILQEPTHLDCKGQILAGTGFHG
jgi:hypothetical protein